MKETGINVAGGDRIARRSLAIERRSGAEASGEMETGGDMRIRQIATG